MKLSALAAQYVAYKQSMGMRFHTEARTLRSFCRAMGDIALAEIAADRVQAYIAGAGPVTRFWHRKHEVLRGFYRFAMARGYAASSPLPKIVPKPPHFVPHIFSHDELQRLLDATACCESPRCKLQPYTCRMLILLLYGTGMRISEALSLRLTNVDLTAGVLTIRESKFYKTRLVPMSPALTSTVREYVARRAKEHATQLDGALFLTRTGTPVARHTAENVFSRLRVRAGVLRQDGSRYQPRLHDLRHAFAVHRLVSWYRQGADVQRLLPQLATYLGHVHIAATQRYLTLTPELLHEASQRFERYAWGGSMNDLTLLGPWVRRFLLEHLVAERNLARNTQRSYRDALTLLIPFVADKLHQSVDRLTVINVSADLVRLFLTDLEQSRKCSIATRNQRLAAIHALARFVGEHSPEHIAWCGQIRSIPFKKASKTLIPYLDKPEMDALLGAPDRQTPRAAGTTHCCCFSTTPGHALMKPHRCLSAN